MPGKYGLKIMDEFELKYSIPCIPDAIGSLRKVSEKQTSDLYFDTDGYRLLKGGNFLRVRGDSIDFKLFKPDDLLRHLSCVESGFKKPAFSCDNNALCKLLESLGFCCSFGSFDEFVKINELIVLAEISRTRHQYSVNENTSLSIDDVNDFGYFLEIEKIFPDREIYDPDKERNLLERYLSDNEILPEGSAFVPVGYVELYLKKYNYEAYKLGKHILPEDR